jgi:hypothetical protein
MTKHIIAGIREYASAHTRFQRLQDAHRDHLPRGSQKTSSSAETQHNHKQTHEQRRH